MGLHRLSAKRRWGPFSRGSLTFGHSTVAGSSPWTAQALHGRLSAATPKEPATALCFRMSLDSCHRMDASSIGPAMRASRSATVQRKRGSRTSPSPTCAARYSRATTASPRSHRRRPPRARAGPHGTSVKPSAADPAAPSRQACSRIASQSSASAGRARTSAFNPPRSDRSCAISIHSWLQRWPQYNRAGVSYTIPHAEPTAQLTVALIGIHRPGSPSAVPAKACVYQRTDAAP